MPEVRVGQTVRVNLAGLNLSSSSGSVQVGTAGEVSASGTVVAVDAAKQLITVKLNVAMLGHDTVVVSPDRVLIVT